MLKAIPPGIDISNLIEKRDELSEYFISYIQQVKNYPQKYVRNRTFLQKLTGLPPAIMSKLETPLFLKDPGMHFTNVFFGKFDFDWLWIMAGVMTAFHIWKTTPVEGALVLFTYYKIFFQWPR